ncbi:hypothetical protein [Histophilus somni]|uniref:Uncharacterized protein n=1 Tax=Histophilus somni TaxID=731 RepID=A0A9Q7E824_HISSO|nr:hypothetical protein [Histophilus somni]ARU64630.1 hypothetical protein BTV18_03520 [Histophilus somni]ARU66496.1 hypothetical protein BTV19_03955 [Histophilus somni]ARU68370.1 hypothetical protein BTV16_03955 [Histophilus somni]ARU70248.1 hypothetical protein BTV20_03960 [Histophilus somni]ARU72124.1 hypothetical protein BTV17_03950 [Histophilus somni]
MIKTIIYLIALFLAVFSAAALKHIGIFIYIYWKFGDFYWAEDALSDILSFAIPLFIGLCIKKIISNKFNIK